MQPEEWPQIQTLAVVRNELGTRSARYWTVVYSSVRTYSVDIGGATHRRFKKISAKHLGQELLGITHNDALFWCNRSPNANFFFDYENSTLNQ